MKNWLKIIVTLTVLGLFSNANAQGYCDSSGASEDGDGVITFTGDESAIGDCAFAPDEYIVKIYNYNEELKYCTNFLNTKIYEITICIYIIRK